MHNQLSYLLCAVFLFEIGAFYGWVIEVLFRRFFSKKNPEKKWLNPGFCMGPYLPLYGCGLVILFFMSAIGDYLGYGETLLSKITLFIIMALIMTIVELIAGLISLKIFHIKLWDYSDNWGNIMGLICPKFSFFWALMSGAYYFLIQPRIVESVYWLAEHLTFSFFVGAFFGIFVLDVIISSGAAFKLRKYALENGTVIEQTDIDSAGKSKNRFGTGLINFLYNSRVGKENNQEQEALEAGAAAIEAADSGSAEEQKQPNASESENK